MILNLDKILLAGLVGLAIGGFAGFYVKSKFVKAELVDQVVEQRKEDAEAVEKMQEKEAVLQDRVEEVRVVTKTVVKEVLKYVPAPTSHQESSACPDTAAGELTVGAVRLLNAARANTTVDTASWDDGESQAPSGVTYQEFVLNDLEVVGMYHDLAIRHDMLVDWVREQVIAVHDRFK